MNRDCDCIHEEDWVESKLNTNVFGIVVGGSAGHVYVQLSPSLEIRSFHVGTLRRIDWEDDEYHGPDGGKDLPADDNIIDFTKARKLRADTKTKGAA